MRKTFLFILALCAASAVWGTPVTVTKTAKEIGTAAKWSKSTAYATAKLDDVITITVTPGTKDQKNGVYYTGDYEDTHDWRMYQARAEGQFAITAAEGYVITSVTLTYEVTNTGVVSTAVKESGVATPAANQILSGTAYTFADNELTFYVGNTTAATTNGQARIRTFSVTYEKGIYDDFRDPTTGELLNYTSAIEKSVTTQCFTWIAHNCRFNNNQTMDKLADNTPSNTMWQGSASYLSTTVEGGIKIVFFPWNQAAAAEAGYTETVTVTVDKDNTKTKSQSREGKAAASRGADSKFSYACNVSKNAEVKIAITSGNRITVGPITIVPYIRYTQKAQNANAADETYDATTGLINNTLGGVVKYSIVTDGAQSEINETTGVIDMSNVTTSEDIVIKASYEDAYTTMNLHVNALPIPMVTFLGITDGKKSVTLDVESFTEAATVDMTVPVVYSSSNENVATVKEDGEVTVLTTGTTEITAKVEAKEGEYKEASATYTLTVTASEASEVSFVEKFSGVSRCEDNTCGYTTEAENFIGTDGLFHWTVNSVRLRKGDVIGKGGLRFSNSLEEGSYHLLPDPNYNDGIMEGGIKRIAFTYKEAANGSGVNLEISAGEVLRYVKSNSETETQFAANFFVKENTSLKMFNTKGASVVTIGPISIVPYLLFTTKSDEAFLSLVDEYDVKNVLINNTDDGTVAYSVLTQGAKSQISDEGIVTFTDVTKSETITIQAAWTPDGESSATVITTMTLYVDAEYETDKTVKEKFSNYGATGWASSEAKEATKKGDVYYWRTQLTRHNTADKLIDDQQAIWFAQGGYVATADATDSTKVGPAEGGIKRIAFNWHQNAGDQTGDDLYISVSVDGTEMSAIRRDGGAQPTEPWQYIHNLNVKKNATLKIENKSTTSKSEGGRVKIGTIVITPYLLYTKKELSAKLSDETAINVDICNNTIGGEITYSSLNPEVASLANDDPSHPDKLKLNNVGDAVIVATWTPDGSEEVVTTSYTLHVTEKADRGLSFQDAVKETTVGGPVVTNTLNGTFDGTAQTWSTASEGVVTSVSTEGIVSPVAIGTDTVTVKVAASGAYQEGTASYKVIVRTGVADNNKLVESFSGITKDASTSETEWKGDLQNYFSWKVKSTRHKGTAGDTIGGAGVAGTVLFAKGQIVTDGVIEGGIKYFTFNWKQPYVEQGATLRLTLNAGDKAYQQDYVVAIDNGSTTHEHLYFAGNMQVKKNVQLTLKNESFKTESDDPLTSDGRIAIDKFEIVPYLFYKTKSHKIDVVGGDEPTWTNEDLINNTDGGTIVYSVPEGNGVATIDPELGEVTAVGNGITTVTATWTPANAEDGEVVTTTYTLEVFAERLDAELDFNPKSITVGVDAIAFSTPTLSNPHELTVKYFSSDETIATVDENSGEVTLIGKAGDVIISATSEVTDTYKEGSASYTIHVLPLPDVSFPYLTGNKKTVDMDQVPFTETILIKVNEEDVTSSANITYKSSNEEVAIIEDNKVNIIGVGTAYITAKIAQTEIYAGRDVYYTLTVEDKTPAEKQWTETFPGLSQGSYYDANPYKFTGKDGVYSWAMRTFRCKTDGNDDKVGGDQGIRIKDGTKSNYIEFDGKQEGGVKRVKFDWRQPGDVMAADLNIKIDNTVQDNLTLHRDAASKDVNSYNRNVFVKSNTKMTITVPTGGNAIIIGPITITPYLLYTTKTATLNLTESSTYKNEDLINNLELDDEVNYSIIKGNEGSIATIDADGMVTATAAGEITIQAKWTDGDNTITTTYKLKIEKHITISESADNTAILAANAGQTVDVKIVRSALVANTWNSLCLPFDIEKSELGDAKVAILDRATLEDDVLNIWLATVTGETLTAGTPYLVLPSENIDLSKTYENKLIVAEEGNQEVYMVTLQGTFSSYPMTEDDKTTLFLSTPDEYGNNLFYPSKNGSLKGMRAYFSINTPSGAPVRVGRIGIQQTPTELGGEADRLNGRQAMKVLRDGQFYIIRETKTYNAQGIEIQ